MAIRAFLAAVALTTSLAGAAWAQQPPEGEEPPQQSYEPPPQQGYAPPPQQGSPPPGYAPPPEGAAPMVPAGVGLGAPGQITLSDDVSVMAMHYSSSYMGQSTTQTAIVLQPAIDVFVAPNLSIGGQVRIVVNSIETNDSTTIGLLPRIGYNIPIGPTASIWPRASLGYIRNSISGNGSSSSNYSVAFIAFVPVLFQPAPHFFIGGGPYLSTDLVAKFTSGGASSDSSKLTAFGLQSTLGGYFGGT
jgi:hypothetical protein